MQHEAHSAWFADNAQALDQDSTLAAEVVPRLARAGAFGADGQGGPLWDAVESIAKVAGHSLTAAFAFWGHRAFIEYLLQSPNAALRQRWLPALIAGEHAGATGLSNAMKYLGGIESLGIQATATAGGWLLDGSVPWCTNLRPEGFVAAAVVARSDGPPLVTALPSGRAGLVRSADLDLIALRGSNTASLAITAVEVSPDDLLHDNANVFLPRVRPAFLGLQCGLSIGLARAALATAAQAAGGGRAGRSVLDEPLQTLRARLDASVAALREGLASGRFLDHPALLFQLRLDLADTVQQAVQLELQASGGRAYHRDLALSFARHWREAAFIPIVTPSVTQLRGELARRAQQQQQADAAATPATLPQAFAATAA